MSKYKIGYAIQKFPPKELRPWETSEINTIRKNHKIEIIPDLKPISKESVKGLDFIIVSFIKRAERFMNIDVPYIAICHSVSRGKEGITQRLLEDDNCLGIGWTCQYMKNMMIEKWGVDRLVHTPISARVNEFYRSNSLGYKVVCGARLIPIKGIDLAIKSFPDIWCFGTGNQMDELKLISNQSHFVGWQDANQLRNLMEESWLYVFPGLIDDYGYGGGLTTTIKEALLMELQVMCPIENAEPEFLPYVNIIDRSVDSIKEVATTIERKRNKLGREYVLQHYNSNVWLDNILEYIKDKI